MSAVVANELERFHQFVEDKLGSSSADLTPEEVLSEWRATHPSPDDLSESVVAIKQALADMRAGDRGRPAEQVIAELRQRLESSARS